MPSPFREAFFAACQGDVTARRTLDRWGRSTLPRIPFLRFRRVYRDVPKGADIDCLYREVDWLEWAFDTDRKSDCPVWEHNHCPDCGRVWTEGLIQPDEGSYQGPPDRRRLEVREHGFRKGIEMPREIHRFAYAVTDVPMLNGERRSRWHQVGVSFLNRDGSETILLDALPLSGKLVLQVPKSETTMPPSQQLSQSTEEEEKLEL